MNDCRYLRLTKVKNGVLVFVFVVCIYTYVANLHSNNMPNELVSMGATVFPDLHGCKKPTPKYRRIQNGKFWILENYVKASQDFTCDESITFATQAEFTYLDNLDIIAQKWQVKLVKWHVNVEKLGNFQKLCHLFRFYLHMLTRIEFEIHL